MMDLRTIARALGGEVAAAQVIAPGPGHSPRDRSLSVRLSATSPGGFIVYSFAGDCWEACIDYVRSRLELPRDGWKRERQRAPSPKPASKVGGDDQARLKLALELFDEAEDAHETEVRKLELPDGADVIRFHPRCVFGGERVPCMLALFRHNLTNEPLGIQRTKLSSRGWVRGMKMQRLNLGPTGCGSIKLDDDAGVLYGLTLGEGTETVLLPEPVQSLSVHWEPDADADVRQCVNRWSATGRETIILQSLFGKDAADSLWEGGP